MLESIKNDKIIIDIYNKIEDFENLNKGWAYHNYNHVLNVMNIFDDVLVKLGYDDEFVEEAKIACILHDIGALEGKDDHAERSYIFAKKYIEDNNIQLKYKDLVLEAIRVHSDGFDTDNIMALVLIFADKLDVKKTRVAEEGKNILGMRQLMYINDILVEIIDNRLIVNFLVDDNINISELNDFYFTKKVFKAIETFALKMNLGYKILMNSIEWILV